MYFCCDNPNLVNDGAIVACFACHAAFPATAEPDVAFNLRNALPTNPGCCALPDLRVDMREGQHVCTACGAVHDKVIVESYGYDEDGSKTHHEGGRVGDRRQIIRSIRATKWNLLPYTTRDKLMFKAMHIMSKHDISPCYLSDVMDAFDQMEHTHGMLRGKNLDATCCALMYVALRRGPGERSIQECAAYVGVTVKKFTRILKFVDAKTKHKVEALPLPEDHCSMINRYASALGLSFRERKEVARRLVLLEFAPVALYTKIALAIYSLSAHLLDKAVLMLNVRKPTVLRNYERYKEALCN